VRELKAAILCLGICGLVAPGCGKSGATRNDAAGAGERGVCAIYPDCPPGSCCMVSQNDWGVQACMGWWSQGSLPTPWWTATPPTACETGLSHSPRQMYDDCDNTGAGKLWPSACGVTGQVTICANSPYGGTGYLTETCKSDNDCPAGTKCEQGTSTGLALCEKKCTGTGGDTECVRCDMACNAVDQDCEPKAPVADAGVPCVADCQCVYLGLGICYMGYCNPTMPIPPVAVCPQPTVVGGCDCTGGTCTNDCCYAPDGHIAYSPRDPICSPHPG
jgi:hypothetical protein